MPPIQHKLSVKNLLEETPRFIAKETTPNTMWTEEKSSHESIQNDFEEESVEAKDDDTQIKKRKPRSDKNKRRKHPNRAYNACNQDQKL